MITESKLISFHSAYSSQWQ